MDPTPADVPADGGQRPGGVLPLFPLGTVLVPGMPLSLHVFEPRYRQLVADLLAAGTADQAVFGVVALRRGWEVGALGDLYDVGTCARVVGLRPHPDGRYDLAAIGTHRFVIEALDTSARPYLVGRVRYLAEPDSDTGPADVEDLAARLATARAACDRYLAALAALTDAEVEVEVEQAGAGPGDARAASYAVARLTSLALADRQSLLACGSTAARLALARSILHREAVLLARLRAIPAGASHFRDHSTLS